MISSRDDHPVHQTSEPVRFVHTSDRNFYDRHNFAMHASSGESCMVMGLGQSPDLGTFDEYGMHDAGSGAE